MEQKFLEFSPFLGGHNQGVRNSGILGVRGHQLVPLFCAALTGGRKRGLVRGQVCKWSLMRRAPIRRASIHSLRFNEGGDSITLNFNGASVVG